MKKITSEEYFQNLKRLPNQKGGRFSVIAIIYREIMNLARYDNSINIERKKRITWPQQMKRLLP